MSRSEEIDATKPAGKLQMHILGAIAEFERARIVERVRAGLARRAALSKVARAGRDTPSATTTWRARSVSRRGRRQRSSLSHAAVHRARAVSKPLRTASRIAPETAAVSRSIGCYGRYCDRDSVQVQRSHSARSVPLSPRSDRTDCGSMFSGMMSPTSKSDQRSEAGCGGCHQTHEEQPGRAHAADSAARLRSGDCGFF